MSIPENFGCLKYSGTFRGDPVVAEYRDKGLVLTRNGPVYASQVWVGDRFVHELRIDAESVTMGGPNWRRRLEQKYLAETDMFLEGF